MNATGLVPTAETIGETVKANDQAIDKAKAIAPLVAQEILISAFMANKKIADPVKFQAACTALAGNFADPLNSLHADGVNSESKA